MIELILPFGGREFLNDDLSVIQAETRTVCEAIFSDLGVAAFVVRGARLTQVSGSIYSLSAGVCYIDGKWVELAAQAALDLSTPKYIYRAAPVEYDERLYADGNVKNSLRRYSAAIAAAPPPSGAYITVSAGAPPPTVWTIVQRQSMPLGAHIMVDDVSEFNLTTGLGFGSYQGWAICDGRNGTYDARGRFPVFFHPTDNDYNEMGETGGQKQVTLTVEQMPAHSHAMNSNVFNDATQTQYALNNNSNVRIGTNNTEQTGGGQPHENRPPYMVFALVKKIN